MSENMTSQTSENSIFDFIYLDLPKIRSYMAQMRGGVDIENTLSSGKSGSTGYKFSLNLEGEGGFDIPFIADASSKASGTGERSDPCRQIRTVKLGIF